MWLLIRAWFRFFCTVLIHKYHILVWGWKLKVPLWQLICHDFSKLFNCTETRGYLKYYYPGITEQELSIGWLHHQNRNAHHWEYWVTRDDSTFKAMPMPMNYVREMVADWIAANKAYSNGKVLINGEFLKKAVPKWTLHDQTKQKIVQVLSVEMKQLGYEVPQSTVQLFH